MEGMGGIGGGKEKKESGLSKISIRQSGKSHSEPAYVQQA